MTRVYSKHLMPFAVVCLAVGLMVPGNSVAQNKGKRLTCSFIAKQCRVECAKEAPELFCNDYCTSKRRECLETGNWFGISRTFKNVRRK